MLSASLPARRPYVGRFAPSPTGPLHAGSLVAALASWLDARACGGRWLVRLEDTDTPRCVPEAGPIILSQLASLGLLPDEAPVWQSQRTSLYEAALQTLISSDQVYPCGCTRSDIEAHWLRLGLRKERHAEWVYPGTCRDGLNGLAARAWRLRSGCGVEPVIIQWIDRRLGQQTQNVTQSVGDFVLRRADGIWAYQLAVVVDDAAQGVTHVVRGEDLADNTPRQIHLQRHLGLPTPIYLHTPLVRGLDGEKLSKQHGAAPLTLTDPVRALLDAAHVLGLRVTASRLADALSCAVSEWRSAFPADPAEAETGQGWHDASLVFSPHPNHTQG